MFFVCFNLGDPLNQQLQQISYWLDFLNSSLPLPHHQSNSSNLMPSAKIILIGLQSDKQKDFHITANPQQTLAAWQTRWNHLPIASTLFSVSSHTSISSVQTLLTFVTEECNQIFSIHSVRIPLLYHKILSQLPNHRNSPIHWQDLFKEFSPGTDITETSFQTMLRYFEGIGRIVWLPTGFVFTDPTVAPKIAAKFISPLEVRLSLLKQEDENVQILNEMEVGSLLNIRTENNEKLKRELELMLHLSICYELRTAGLKSVHYLFPSLSAKKSSVISLLLIRYLFFLYSCF